MDRAEVQAAEAASPSQVGERGGQEVMRYEPVRVAGLDCRVVYIFARDKLVRTKYVFQRDHEDKNGFLVDFTIVEAFLAGTMAAPIQQRVTWRDDSYKGEPQNYGLAVSLGQLLYVTQWRDPRTIVTHALTGHDGMLIHEIEYVSVELEAWEDQVAKEPGSPADTRPRTLQSATQ